VHEETEKMSLSARFQRQMLTDQIAKVLASETLGSKRMVEYYKKQDTKRKVRWGIEKKAPPPPKIDNEKF
jgi:hypothetical protein